MKNSFKFFSLNFRYFILLLFIIVVSCILPFNLMKNYNFNEEDLLSFYGSFLTFIGTFTLGYVTYIRDDKQRRGEAHDKSRILQWILRNTQNYFFIQYTEHTKIEYDKKWHEYYYEFEYYIGYHDSELELFLVLYFKTLDEIAECISRKQIKEAEIIAKDYIEKQKYEVGKYNLSDATDVILLDLLGNAHRQKPWFKRRKVRKKINKYKKDFYSIIENWVYMYILKSNSNTVKMQDYILELYNWLLGSKMFKELNPLSYEQRIVCRMAYETVLSFSKKSKKLDHCWYETSLREKDSQVQRCGLKHIFNLIFKRIKK